MKWSNEGRRLVAAIVLVGVAGILSTTAKLHARTQGGYCVSSDPSHKCISGGVAYNSESCDAGGCTTCIPYFSHCDPVGSGIDIEDWAPGN